MVLTLLSPHLCLLRIPKCKRLQMMSTVCKSNKHTTSASSPQDSQFCSSLANSSDGNQTNLPKRFSSISELELNHWTRTFSRNFTVLSLTGTPSLRPLSQPFRTASYHQSSVCHKRYRNWPAQKHFPIGIHSSLLTCVNTQPTCYAHFSATRLIIESSPQLIQPYLRLIRFDKPIGNWLLYWPCTWSIALAAQPGCMPDVWLLTLFGAGAFFMRGAGCIINDMWDKEIDAKVERTRQRPLACGELTKFQALIFLGTQLSCALAILLQLNTYSIILGAASMALVILYPLAKRYTYWPQLILGLTLNWGVLLAWSGLRSSVELPGLTLYASCTLYTLIYDSIYSHQDKYDDMLIGVKSTALYLGDKTKPWLSVFTALMAGGLTTSGYLCDMTWPYYVAVGLTGARLLQQIYSVDLNNADSCAHAFRGNFYLGAIMFVGIVLANLLKAKDVQVKCISNEGELKRRN